MMAAAALRPDDLPLRARGDRGGLGRAALLALLAHALLIAALSSGLNWRLRQPETVYAAELWSAVPQVAAPAPVQPPPAPPPEPARVERRAPPAPEPARPDAQIAIERAERQKKLAQEQADAERRAIKAREDKAREDKLRDERLKEEQRRKDASAQRQAQAQAQAQAEEQRLARQREANLARIRGLADASGPATATGNATRDAAPSAAYAGRIKARIKPNIVLAVEVNGNPVTEVEVRCAPDGTIIGRRVVKRSGHDVWDETVLRAIDRTEMLPRDVDGRIPSTMLLVFPRQE